MLVSDAVGAALTELGVDTVFGLVGSGNFHVTNALIANGARFVAARHECGAASMADAWARLAGRPGILSVHQGPGLTNALTGIAEAAKSRTPMVVLAADMPSAAVRSNFRLDVAALARGIGAVPARLHSPGLALDDTVRAYRTAADERRTVILAMPLDVQASDVQLPEPGSVGALGSLSARRTAGDEPDDAQAPVPAAVIRLAEAIGRARRPVFIAGRGARHGRAGADLARLADACGALLATSAAAKGLFRGNPWDLDISGGFASPLAAELITGADLVIGWGCSLNMWTMRHGTLIGPDTVLAQVDIDQGALGAYRPVDIKVAGDVVRTARQVSGILADGSSHRKAITGAASSAGSNGGAAAGAGGDGGVGYRSGALRERIAQQVRWRDVPYTDDSDGTRIDPRTLSIALDDMLPDERLVAVDSGNFMGYPSMYLSVPDADGFCFTQGFQAIGLGLASAIGSAIARPDRLVVAALGDGGALMGVSELETAVRLGLGMVIVVYDDEAYGAEVHHFGPDGHPLDTVRFPPVDIAAIARGFGCGAAKVRQRADLAPLSDWLNGPRDRPFVIDAKITSEHPSWWLEEAFR